MIQNHDISFVLVVIMFVYLSDECIHGDRKCIWHLAGICVCVCVCVCVFACICVLAILFVYLTIECIDGDPKYIWRLSGGWHPNAGGQAKNENGQSPSQHVPRNFGHATNVRPGRWQTGSNTTTGTFRPTTALADIVLLFSKEAGQDLDLVLSFLSGRPNCDKLRHGNPKS